jgi:DNA-binding NarL/FixJ family response regulator
VPLRLLIADDNKFVRFGVRIALSDKQDWQICGEVTNGQEAVGKVQELSPDVVILDPSKGFEIPAQIRLIAPRTKIVFFTPHDVPAAARQIIGADAFVSQTASAQELIATIQRVSGEPRQSLANAKSV